MNTEQINNFIKESHENAVEKGFYDCSECGGEGNIFQKNPDCKNCNECDEYFMEDLNNGKSLEVCTIASNCQSCNGTGIDQNKNIPELLMLVITEISEAVEALRENRIFMPEICFPFFKDYNFEKLLNGLKSNNTDEIYFAKEFFEVNINNSFQDEIADTFIRLFDLCGYLGIEIDETEWKSWPCGVECAENRSEALFDIVDMIVTLRVALRSSPYSVRHDKFMDIFKHLIFFCECSNIDIEKHITAKMQYNKTRPKKYGKEF